MKKGMIDCYSPKALSKKELIDLIDKNFGDVGNIAVLMTVASDDKVTQTISFGKPIDESVFEVVHSGRAKNGKS